MGILTLIGEPVDLPGGVVLIGIVFGPFILG